MKRLHVVAAVVRRGGAILVTRRPDRPGKPGQWEFPGGKVEPGEAEPEALRRELAEELGASLEVGGLLLRHTHRYAEFPEFEVELAFYSGRLADPDGLRLLGVAEVAWAPVGTLADYDFLEADRAVLGELQRLAVQHSEGDPSTGAG